jgi:ABC-type uncharacterized transport system involved in gliding motility auxiliary subunit
MNRNSHDWAGFVAVLGVGALLGGWLRYSTQGELLLASKILLVAGAVLVLGAAALGFRQIGGFFSKRSSQLGTNTSVLAFGVIAILAVINYLGSSHHKRFDLTTEKYFTLSDQSQKVAGGLGKDVNVVRFAKSADPQFDDLMSEYKNQSRHFKFQTVDPQEKPEIAKDYGATHMGDVIMASGDQKQTIQTDPNGGVSESDVTSALLKVNNAQHKTVCFVTGHGERSLTDQQSGGYMLADQGLKKENYNTEPINLVSSNGVPSDCDVVVVADPTKALFPQEAAMIATYLNAGGKVLIEADPETDPNLDDIFNSWNIAVGKNIVVDASGVGRLLGLGPATPLVVDYGDSPITKNLQQAMTFFDMARTVSLADKAKSDPQQVEVLKTSPRSFTIPKMEKEVTFNPKTDTAGPLSLGVAASKDVNGKSARLVVIGDSDFASNQWINSQHNGDLFFNTIDWLAQDENQISIRPKQATDRRVTLTAGQATLLRWFDLIFLPGVVLISGVYIWWKRR